MNIIGISGLTQSVPFKRKHYPNLDPRHYRITQGFDAAAALVNENSIVAAAAEERFTKEKTTGAFPVNAINYCLNAANLKIENIDFLVHNFNYLPYVDYFRETELGGQLYDQVLSKEVQLQLLQEHFPTCDWKDKFIQLPHHLTHAASTFYVSGFPEALILVADGMGEQQSLTVALGEGKDIKILKQIPSIHSLGILYSVFTLYLGFVFNMDEYKVMGLAPYGNSRKYYDSIMGLIELQEDGTHTIPILFQNTTLEEKETYGGTIKRLTELFGPPRTPESEITQEHMDIAAALQAALLNAMMHLLKKFQGCHQPEKFMHGGWGCPELYGERSHKTQPALSPHVHSTGFGR